MPLLILIFVISGIASGYGCFRLAQIHYRQRWLTANRVIDTLQGELEQQTTEANRWHQVAARNAPLVQPVKTAASLPMPQVTAMHHILTPAKSAGEWKLTVRTVKGITSVYAMRGDEMEELERVSKSSPDYDEQLAQALRRARRTIKGKNL
jgi:hypothetical protein